MSAAFRHRIQYRRALFDLFACAAGFGSVSWLYQILAGKTGFSIWSADGALAISISAATCWLVMVLSYSPPSGGFKLWIDQFFSAAGLNLMVQYGLAYVFLSDPVPLWIVLLGTVVSIALIIPLGRRFSPALTPEPSGILLLGLDSMASALVPFLREQIVGVLDGDAARVSPELPFLGDLPRLAEAVKAKRPGRIVVSERNWRSQVPPKLLLNLRYSGIAIDEGAALYEDTLCRVRWDRLQPFDLLFSSSMNANRSAMAIQAVYTNLIGLGLLVALFPVLIVIPVLIALFSGCGPVLERIECTGFQGIPFHMLRFRVRGPDGESSWIGKAISLLHVVNLPQLINVVRGEMALFGPPPARRKFADRLSQIISVYSHRFTVKPGILGWSQTNLRETGATPDETVRLEYDLYYVKEESPSLDLEIFIRTIFRIPSSSGGAPQLRAAAGSS
jgi:lipopolysaccharide/colanic/teichoic acid biosynthesis glycosyltransferase